MAITWSLGACLVSDERPNFDAFLKDIYNASSNKTIPSKMTFYDVKYETKTR